MNWAHWIEVTFWSLSGAAGYRLSQKFAEFREMKYNFQCSECPTSFKMTHNPNNVLEKMIDDHMSNSHPEIDWPGCEIPEPETEAGVGTEKPSGPVMSNCTYYTDPVYVGGRVVNGEPTCIIHNSFSKWDEYYGAHRPCLTVDP